MIELTHPVDLQATLDSTERVVVVFSARDWCVPCKRLNPHILEVEKTLPNIAFVEVDIDKAPEIRQQYDIMSVPTIYSFQDGQVQQVVKARTAVALAAELS